MSSCSCQNCVTNSFYHSSFHLGSTDSVFQISRLKERFGFEPSDDQLATSLKISRTELQSKLIECSLAREKLAMSNVRLVMSIAQRYDNMGAEMSDLVQVLNYPFSQGKETSRNLP